jgi:hypothetical protein
LRPGPARTVRAGVHVSASGVPYVYARTYRGRTVSVGIRVAPQAVAGEDPRGTAGLCAGAGVRQGGGPAQGRALTLTPNPNPNPNPKHNFKRKAQPEPTLNINQAARAAARSEKRRQRVKKVWPNPYRTLSPYPQP